MPITWNEPGTDEITNDLGKSLVREIAEGFLVTNRGEKVRKLKDRLGKQWRLLEELERKQYITTFGETFFPAFSSLYYVNPNIRGDAERATSLVIGALRTLSASVGAGPHSYATVMSVVNSKLDRPVDPSSIRAGMLFTIDFPNFINSSGGSPDQDIFSVGIADGIYEFESLESAWKSEIERRMALRAEVGRIKSGRVHSASNDSRLAITQEDLSFVADQKLRKILERDYGELRILREMPVPKSRLILTGALIEGLLLDALERNDKASISMYKNLKSKSKTIHEWTLDDMIEVALKLALISQGAARLSTAARHFRNLVHPNEERMNDYVIGVEEAAGAEAALKTVIRDLRNRSQKNP